MADMTREELKERIARVVCNFTLKPCPGEACKHCGESATTILALVEEAGYTLSNRSDAELEMREALAPFAMFARPAALAIAGGDDDNIGATVVEHEHQSLSWGAFLMAHKVWNEGKDDA